MRQCHECKYWELVVHSSEGVCKRYPQNHKKHMADYCGEFKVYVVPARMPSDALPIHVRKVIE